MALYDQASSVGVTRGEARLVLNTRDDPVPARADAAPVQRQVNGCTVHLGRPRAAQPHSAPAPLPYGGGRMCRSSSSRGWRA